MIILVFLPRRRHYSQTSRCGKVHPVFRQCDAKKKKKWLHIGSQEETGWNTTTSYVWRLIFEKKSPSKWDLSCSGRKLKSLRRHQYLDWADDVIGLRGWVSIQGAQMASSFPFPLVTGDACSLSGLRAGERSWRCLVSSYTGKIWVVYGLS